jgi:threonine dehydrogenase-like Zn-dependent dehydrogenase
VAVHAVNVRADIEPGQKVVVSGPGPIGVLCGMVAKLKGALRHAQGSRSGNLP